MLPPLESEALKRQVLALLEKRIGGPPRRHLTALVDYSVSIVAEQYSHVRGSPGAAILELSGLLKGPPNDLADRIFHELEAVVIVPAEALGLDVEVFVLKPECRPS